MSLVLTSTECNWHSMGIDNVYGRGHFLYLTFKPNPVQVLMAATVRDIFVYGIMVKVWRGIGM